MSWKNQGKQDGGLMMAVADPGEGWGVRTPPPFKPELVLKLKFLWLALLAKQSFWVFAETPAFGNMPATTQPITLFSQPVKIKPSKKLKLWNVMPNDAKLTWDRSDIGITVKVKFGPPPPPRLLSKIPGSAPGWHPLEAMT